MEAKKPETEDQGAQLAEAKKSTASLLCRDAVWKVFWWSFKRRIYDQGLKTLIKDLIELNSVYNVSEFLVWIEVHHFRLRALIKEGLETFQNSLISFEVGAYDELGCPEKRLDFMKESVESAKRHEGSLLDVVSQGTHEDLVGYLSLNLFVHLALDQGDGVRVVRWCVVAVTLLMILLFLV